ncbi:glycosyltransferase family 2 protein [Anaerohalosphaeraceae bacterium U12dextr]
MQNRYLIITPAFNEGKYIENTIKSVLSQTCKPIVWIIVDDGSMDNTANIVQLYAKEYDWIKYVFRSKIAGQSYYASNVYAIQEGLKHASHIDYDFIAILDADITLVPEYYEVILAKFQKYRELGIATGTYLEKEGDSWVEARIDRRSTPKAIQVFRRKCYEQCGGYIPFKNGGEDSGMEIIARMNGWQTWSFPEIKVFHNRPVGTGDGRSLLKARFRLGLTDYCLGTHPLFMLVKACKRCIWEKPYIISGLMRLSGYLYGFLKQEHRQLPVEAQLYLRKEQLRRLISFCMNKTFWKPY